MRSSTGAVMAKSSRITTRPKSSAWQTLSPEFLRAAEDLGFAAVN
jgi:hypothetical protein